MLIQTRHTAVRPAAGTLPAPTMAFLTICAVTLLGVSALAPAPARAVPGPGLRLNHVQVIGSHNSYHIEPPPDLLQILVGIDPAAIELAYTHPPLPDQFTNEGVRQIELDVYADPNGDLWRPIGTTGFKVFHIEGFDERSTCETLISCLTAVKAWSDTNPTHMPLAILIEVKDTADVPGPPDPIFVDPALFDAMDTEIRSIFPDDRLLTPDDVRGARPTLEEAVLNDGWPLIDDVRGQSMFLLDNKRDTYRSGHPSLEGRVAFTPSAAGQPDAAFIKMNDPLGAYQAEITSLVQAGYVIRTRADTPVITAQSGDTAQRDAALASGAQWVSTDYPIPGLSARWGTNYVAQIPGGTPARCNPVNAPPGCTSSAIENLPPPAPSTTTTASTQSPTSSAARRAVAVTAAPRFTG